MNCYKLQNHHKMHSQTQFRAESLTYCLQPKAYDRARWEVRKREKVLNFHKVAITIKIKLWDEDNVM